MLGCSCCADAAETIADSNWDIYENCDGNADNDDPTYKLCYNGRALNAHNRYRATHKVPALRLDPEVAAKAQQHAERIKQTGKLEASEPADRDNCYENLVKLSEKDAEQALLSDAATNYWYDSSKVYDFRKDQTWEKLIYPQGKDFALLAWRGALTVGFGI